MARAKALEDAGEPYCIVGHSHGGSVMAAALVKAADRKISLARLGRWITVGTPFIDASPSRLLFSRLGPVGKTAFLTLIASFVSLMYAVVVAGLYDRAIAGIPAVRSPDTDPDFPQIKAWYDELTNGPRPVAEMA